MNKPMVVKDILLYFFPLFTHKRIKYCIYIVSIKTKKQKYQIMQYCTDFSCTNRYKILDYVLQSSLLTICIHVVLQPCLKVIPMG